MAVASISNAGDFYVQIRLDNGNALLATVDLTTGEAIPVSNTESPVSAAFDFPDIGTELVGTFNGRLYEWDYQTGAAAAGATLNDLNNSRTMFAFDQDGIAYAYGSDGIGRLYRVDTNNSTQSNVGTLSFSAGQNGGDIAPDGTLYFLCVDLNRNTTNSSLYILDKTDASSTFVGETGRALRGADLAFDCDGNLFGITDPNLDDGETAMLFSVNTTDGSTTDVIEIWSELGEIQSANLAWGPGEGCPPEITCSLDCDTLWSPNHKMKNVGLNAEIVSGRDIVSTNVTVYSDEPEEDQTGDGNHSPDAQDIGLGTLKLRKERKGDGDGRVYLIIITATDNLGRVGTECCTVTVTHDQSKASKASVAGQALSAELECMLTGLPPAGFVQIGN